MYRGKEKSEVEKILKVISSRIIHWNVNYKFSFKKRNCQVFTTDILNSLHLDYKFSPQVDKYFKFINTVGYSNEKIFDNPINSSKENFLTHSQLGKKKIFLFFLFFLFFFLNFFFTLFFFQDDCVNNILKTCPQFEQDFPEEWELLKSFDRSFWMGYLEFSNPKEEHKPSENCPFSNPLLTQSFVRCKLEFSGNIMSLKKSEDSEEKSGDKKNEKIEEKKKEKKKKEEKK